jgi:alpha-mannosidase
VADKGEHDFVYSIYPHSGDWRVGDTVREAYQVNVPLCAEVGNGAGCGGAMTAFAAINRPNVIVDTIKGAEDGNGLIVRVYESQGARCEAELTFGFELADATECNLMEDDEHAVSVDGGKLRFYIKPYEIKTILLR